MRERDAVERRAATVIARTTATRAMRSGAVWGAVLGLLVANEALTYHSSFPTAASRKSFATAFGHNRGLTAVVGPGRELDTIAGFVAWRMLFLIVVVGAIWGLLTATRLLRGEEDAGRWELLLAGHTTRRGATGQALIGLAAGWITLWALIAVPTAIAGTASSVDFRVSSSLFYAIAAAAPAAMFLAIGALASQLAATRRQANGLAAAVFGVSYLLRTVADSRTGADWLRWASPLGWVENLHPLTGSQPLAFVPIALVTAAAATGAILLAGRRDVGVSAVVRPESGNSGTQLLDSPALLTVRLERWVALAWICGLGALALLFGIVARAAGSGNIGSTTVGRAVSRLGGDAAGARAWIGYEFLYLAAILAFAAAGQVAAMWHEESEGHLDNVFARQVSRQSWLAGRLAVAGFTVVAAGMLAGLGGWLGMAGTAHPVSIVHMAEAGLNIVTPALFVLGLGTLLFGIAPRWAAPVLYFVVLWSFVIEIVGSTLVTNHWLLDTAVLSHLGPVPAVGVHWVATGWLLGLSVATALIGAVTLGHRDLEAA